MCVCLFMCVCVRWDGLTYWAGRMCGEKERERESERARGEEGAFGTTPLTPESVLCSGVEEAVLHC